MKIKLILIFFSLMYFKSFAQSDTLTYPRISTNDTNVVEITIEQAQKIDNDLELLSIFKKLKTNNDNTSVAYISVIDEQKNQITLMELKISDLESINNDQKLQINNLRSLIDNYKQDLKLCDEQGLVKDEMIKNLKKQNRKLKFQKITLFAIDGLVIVGVGYLFLVSH